MLTQEELKKQLHYNPDTGVFTRKVSNSASVVIGEVAGGLTNKGYRTIRVHKKRYSAHRLAFLYMEGYFPEYEVDHRKGCKDDNRFCELIHVSHECNSQNRKINRNNTSNFPGVSWHRRDQRWLANVRFKNKLIYLGTHNTALDAALARLTWEIWCPLWMCNHRSEIVKAIKNVWPEFKGEKVI